MRYRLPVWALLGTFGLWAAPRALADRVGSVPEAELIWPWERVALLWRMDQAKAPASRPTGAGGTWPKPLGALCSGVPDTSRTDAYGGESARLLREACLERSLRPPFRGTLNASLSPTGRRYPLGTPFESFGGNWESRRVDAEAAAAWSALPPAAALDLAYPISPRTYARFRLGLRRDLRAWHQDPLGGNLPLSADEVDINEPSFGYFHAESDHFAFTLGRHPVHWSPSPEFGVTLSRSAPFHDAFQAAFKTPGLRYRILYSSLNTWLQGTPLSDSSSEDYPPGSEEYRQRHYPHVESVNAQRRVYADRAKTLLAHRLEGEFRGLEAGITEMLMVGGKSPDLQDANPFSIYHNSFKDGYTNSALSFDARLRLPAGFSLGGELMLDDLVFGTETRRTSASLSGTMALLEHAFQAWGWVFRQSLHWIRTDPFLYGYYQPYNTFYSRRILASNMQEDGDAFFVDKYVIDYPIGYERGADASDLRYRLDAVSGRAWTATLELGILAKGETGADTPFETRDNGGGSAPSGTEEREIRLASRVGVRLRPGLELVGGLAWQAVRDAGHRSGTKSSRIQAAAGLEWSFPR